MTAAEYVERAATWSREMARFRSRGPGDLENAMWSIQRDYAIDYWVQWRLRYRLRQVKSIAVDVYVRIKAAHQAECERQCELLGEQIENAASGTDPDTLHAAACLVGVQESWQTKFTIHAQCLASENEDKAG